MVVTSDAVTLDSTMAEPLVAKFNDTHALIVYRPSSALTNPSLMYRLVTIDTEDISASLSAEATLSYESTYVQGYALVRLAEDTVLVVYKHDTGTTKAVIVTLSGSAVTVSSPSTIDSGNFAPTVVNRQFQLALVSSSTVVLVGRLSASALGFRVLTISGSTVTAGALTTFDTGAVDVTYVRVGYLSGTLGYLSFKTGPTLLRRLTIASTVTVESQSYNLNTARPFAIEGFGAQEMQIVDAQAKSDGTLFISGIAVMHDGVSNDYYEFALNLSLAVSGFSLVGKYYDPTKRATSWNAIGHRINTDNPIVGEVLAGWEIASDELVYATRFKSMARRAKVTIDTTAATYSALDMCYLSNNVHLLAIWETGTPKTRVRVVQVNP